MKKYLALLFALCLLCSVLAGCTPKISQPEATNATVPAPEEGLVGTVTAEGRATVYLPPELVVVADNSYSKLGWQVAARSEDLLVLGAREDEALYKKSKLDFPQSLEEYVTFLNGTGNFKEPLALQENGLYAATYVDTLDEKEMYFYTFAAPARDAFWMVNLACPADQQSQYEELFPHWASLMELN